MEQPVFIIGAGFNADAAAEAGINDVAYPLTPDLARACFPGNDDARDHIEDLFQQAIDTRNRAPLRSLADLIFKADYYIGGRLAGAENGGDNAYLGFLGDFARSALITFNYDSLLELLLFKLGRWRPDDGYGVPVLAEPRVLVNPLPLPERSVDLVLHLHGTLCVYPVEFYIDHQPGRRMNLIKLKQDHDFIFDPYSLGLLFFPFEHLMPPAGYQYPEERIIAPVPHKVEGLRGQFVTGSRERAVRCLAAAGTVVSIGYRYNPSDRETYDPLLRDLRGGRVVLVSPDAAEISDRLGSCYPDVNFTPRAMTFAKWVRSGYPGV